MNLYFELKKLPPKDGPAKIGTIRAILIQQGTKAVIATGEKIAIKDWGVGKPKAIAKNANINILLNKYSAAFDDYISKVKLAEELPSLQKARDYIKTNVSRINAEWGVKDIPTIIQQFRAEKEGIMREGALKPYNTLSMHLTDFNPNIQFADFSEEFSDKFAKFLATKSKHVEGATNLQNPTINKMIVTLKAFCKWAYEKRLTSTTEWMKIHKVKEIDQRIISLTAAELDKYYNFDFGTKANLDRAKDVFCFAAFLGLRYNDLMQVTPENIKGEYLHINTQKNNRELKLKIISQAQKILAKYDNRLPLDISNQKLNKNIKDGVELAGIDRQETVIVQHLSTSTKVQKYVYKLISIHDARKTFVTLCLEKGLSISDVMQMSTHSSYSAFSRYINLEKAKVDEKLESVFDSISTTDS
jgi:integrase